MRTLVLASAALAMAGAAQAAGTAEGDWMTPNGSAKIHIAPCGATLCGTVVWLKTPNDPETGKPQKDAKNPDVSLRDRPSLGLQIIKGMKPSGEGRWADGTIYDPQGGKTYSSKMSSNADGTLKVEGCIVIACVAQTWKPAS